MQFFRVFSRYQHFQPFRFNRILNGVFRFLTNEDLPEKPKKKRTYTMKRPPWGDSIEKRLSEVDTRETFGHWEGDTVYRKKDGAKALFVLTERLTRREIIVRIKVYFCHPYSSYECGSNECQNKMIRRPFPKGTDFGNVTDAEVTRAEPWMNNYPHKILGWKTSEMLFRACVAALI